MNSHNKKQLVVSPNCIRIWKNRKILFFLLLLSRKLKMTDALPTPSWVPLPRFTESHYPHDLQTIVCVAPSITSTHAISLLLASPHTCDPTSTLHANSYMNRREFGTRNPNLMPSTILTSVKRVKSHIARNRKSIVDSLRATTKILSPNVLVTTDIFWLCLIWGYKKLP